MVDEGVFSISLRILGYIETGMQFPYFFGHYHSIISPGNTIV